MDWIHWYPLYQEVIEFLNLNLNKDLDVAKDYLNLVKKYKVSGYGTYLEKLLTKKIKKIWIFGAGPSLPKDFRVFQDSYSSSTDLVIAADGATTFLYKNIFPDIIFSDYDGDLSVLHECCKQGSLMLLHAHGDNYSIVKDHFSLFVKEGHVIPTIQTQPKMPYLFNFGGFTDGDRCIAASLDWFPNIKIGLLGFTFGKIQGRFSKPFLLKNTLASTFKQKKLEFAKFFIESYLIKNYPGQIWNFSSPTEKLEGVRTVIKEFIK